MLDEMPPLVYAPSVAILALMADRPAVVRGSPLSLLTAAEPAYPAAKAGAEGPLPSRQPNLLDLMGELPRLPYTAQESERISALFEPDRVTALRGEGATEKALVAALPGRRIVHIAAHGLADDRFGNKFGALA